MQPAEQDVKMRLLQAAKKLFARQGFDGTTIRQICEEAGANVALISYYFGGKDKIFQALLETFFTQTVMDDILSGEPSPVEGIRKVVKEVILFQLREPELVRLFQMEIMMFSPRIELLRQGKFPLWHKLLHLLEQGREQGTFTFRSIDHTFSFIMSLLFDRDSTYFSPLMREEEQTPEQLIEDMTAFILNGLMYKADS
ncbi:TetR family transcriptional regulator [Cohnella faecalis]|uniref:TetR/AcrR family transcriptional regulator n=1 Tax=Cohnella faecalis TaxID=2315694 RepID=A0A398CE81_9BACL|nr:TetR family transcriptional regulator [Cohnella faecalis]RIE00940.1 TetR/AcrR family transcriptional regulator [Cohnella faecalis]